MCQLLLRHGADVNCNQHEYGYTALMFAGLSGRSWHLFFQDVCNPSVNPYLIPKYFPDLVHFCKTWMCLNKMMFMKINKQATDDGSLIDSYIVRGSQEKVTSPLWCWTRARRLTWLTLWAGQLLRWPPSSVSHRRGWAPNVWGSPCFNSVASRLYSSRNHFNAIWCVVIQPEYEVLAISNHH